MSRGSFGKKGGCGGERGLRRKCMGIGLLACATESGSARLFAWRMPARNYLGGRNRAMMQASSEGEDEGGGAAFIGGSMVVDVRER